MKIDRVKVTRNDGAKGSAGHFKSDYDSYLQFTNLNTETNVTYTLHGFIKSTAAHTVSCLGQSGNTVANQWWEFIFQIIPPKTGFSFFFPPGEYWFYNWKLEKGLITTLWTPNGDDITDMKDTIITMGSSIEQLDKSITQKVWMTEVNSAKQEVETHISTVEQTANKIHWLVKSGDSESNMTLTDNALNIITSYVNIHGKVTFSAIDADAVNKLTALHPVRNWGNAYTTINETVPAVVSDFNRTPRVNEVFTNPDSSANIGTWKITSVSGNRVEMQLLSFTPAKALQCKDNFNGSYTDTTKQYGLSIEKWFNREPLVNEIFKNYDTDSHLGVWKVVSKNATSVQVQLQSYTSVKGNPGKDGTDGKPGTNGRSALQAKRHWTSVYTTIGGTATANTSDFNRTPIVGDTFMNLDGSSNIGTWQITAISGTTVTMKLLSVVNVKGDKGDTGKPGANGKDGADGKPGSKGLNSLQAKRNWTGTFTEVQSTTNCATSDFNRTPVVGDVFTNLDGSCNIGIWQVTVVNGTAVTIKLLFCNTTVSNINSTLKNVKSALNTIAPINNDPTKTVINGGKIQTGTITANSIATNAITSAKIIANAITASKIATNAIIADKIAANAVTADKISVNTLSAINANLGTITAGSLSAVSINNGKGTFTVDANGNMTAKNADISGTITSANINNGNGTFKVDTDGKVSASNINITGGNIDLKRIHETDSALIVQSISSQRRFEINYSNIRGYNDKGNKTFVIGNEMRGFIQLWGENGYNKSGNNGTYLGSGNIEIKTDSTHYTNITSTGLYCSGTKNRVVKTKDYNQLLLYCYEMPSPMFGDIGSGQLDETGKCLIYIDEQFSQTIDSDYNYDVFITKYGSGDCYVLERTPFYFIVSGTPNIKFAWEIKSIQRDYENLRLENYTEDMAKDDSDISGDYIYETMTYMDSLLYKLD